MYRWMYICDFSRSVGVGRATTRNTRGLTRSVIRLIVPPFPAVSRPSNTTQILAPESFTHSCIATSSPCRILICRSYSLRFIFAGGPAPASSPAAEDDARVSASSRSRSFFFLAISLPPINALTSAQAATCRRGAAAWPSPSAASAPGLPGGPAVPRRGARPGETVQVTGVGIIIDSPSTPTGICGASAVISICFVVSTLQPGGMPAAEQASGLPRRCHRDADDAEDAAIQPRAPAQPGDVPGSVRVVGHEQRLRRVDPRAVRLRVQPCSAVALQQVRQRVQRRVQLVAAVGGSLDDLGVRAERRVVDERLAVDHPEVDPQFDAIGQGAQAGRRVLAVQARGRARNGCGCPR